MAAFPPPLVDFSDEQLAILEATFAAVGGAPSSSVMRQLKLHCPIFDNVEYAQIEAWFSSRSEEDFQEWLVTETTRLMVENAQLRQLLESLKKERNMLENVQPSMVLEILCDDCRRLANEDTEPGSNERDDEEEDEDDNSD